MLIIPFFTTYFLICAFIRRINEGISLREAYLISWISLCSLVLISTEILSLFQTVNYQTAFIFWSTISLILVIVMISKRKLKRLENDSTNKNLRINIVTAAICICIISGILFLLAIYCPPNTWDSMTYHMSRVAHWVQNENIAFYPTHILRQLHQPPFAEYLILQLQLLNRGDQFANLPQFAAMLISTLGVSLIANEFNLNRSGQLLTALISITIPMGILQATSTQNDYVLTSMLVCAMYFGMKLSSTDPQKFTILFSVSTALALATKGTGYLFILPIFVFSLVYSKNSINITLRLIGLSALLCSVFNAGHYFRNFNLYGSILGPGREGSLSYANEIFSLQVVTSNIVRNFAIHLGTPFYSVNLSITEFVTWLHHLIGLSISDVRTTWGGMPFVLDPLNPHEDGTGNLLHLLLICIALLIYISKKSIRTKVITGYITCLISCFILFCIYLKWQPWHSRLQLPIFVLWSPIVALSFLSIKICRDRELLLTLSLFIASLPWIIFSATKPLIAKLHSKPPYYKIEENIFNTTRDRQYFINRPKLWNNYETVIDKIENLNKKNIGLIISGDEWEYPLFPLLNGNNISIHHIEVRNQSAFLESKLSNQDLILEINQPTKKEMLIRNRKFTRIWFDNNMSLYQYLDDTQ